MPRSQALRCLDNWTDEMVAEAAEAKKHYDILLEERLIKHNVSRDEFPVLDERTDDRRKLRLGRLRLRGPCGAQFEFTLAAIAQNLRRLAKLVARPPPIAPLCAA
jgi:hypothetical protein